MAQYKGFDNEVRKRRQLWIDSQSVKIQTTDLNDDVTEIQRQVSSIERSNSSLDNLIEINSEWTPMTVLDIAPTSQMRIEFETIFPSFPIDYIENIKSEIVHRVGDGDISGEDTFPQVPSATQFDRAHFIEIKDIYDFFGSIVEGSKEVKVVDSIIITDFGGNLPPYQAKLLLSIFNTRLYF